MWYVYIIQSEKDRRYYIGCTADLERRIKEHNSGYNKSTRLYVPWRFIHTEEFQDQNNAFAREKKIKRYKGGNAFRKLIGI
ncbi:MAG: GIY-YIG nuclease family protein [Patescibacteria group bacterium]